MVLSVAGLAILGQLVSRYAAGLAAAALLYYVLVYTLWLKRRTAWSVVVGSGIGAFPPLVGWVAVTGGLTLTPFLLSAVIALWTLPHVWALALSRRDEYDGAGVAVARTGIAVNGTSRLRSGWSGSASRWRWSADWGSSTWSPPSCWGCTFCIWR